MEKRKRYESRSVSRLLTSKLVGLMGVGIESLLSHVSVIRVMRIERILADFQGQSSGSVNATVISHRETPPLPIED
jgi:hypothetical protein